MNARLRPLCVLILSVLLAACAGSPESPLGELPRTPQASIDQLLQQAAATSDAEQAALLRLSAANLAYQQQDFPHSAQILRQVPLAGLKPAQQVYASTLAAELAMARQQPKEALAALDHPSLQHLAELPVEQQVRTELVRASALEADGQRLAALRERVFVAALLSGEAARQNHERIWSLAYSLSPQELQSSGDADFTGWLELARAVKSAGTLQLQQRAIDAWRSTHPQHPAAQQLPEPLTRLHELANQPLTRIALLLPQQGQLASVARALRDGFIAAHYQAQQAGQVPQIHLYDSSQLTSLNAFYQQAQSDGIQLVVGPLEKPLVKQLGEQAQLPITTLALNYADTAGQGPAQLYQFGLAAEDEAREVARRARRDGLRRAIALVPAGEWGDRVLEAFRDEWQAAGGVLLGAEHLGRPEALAAQIGAAVQLRQAAPQPAPALHDAQPVATVTDFIFLAATPQQAQQVKPTLAYQHAGDLPVYATSHVYSASNDRAQYLDLDGVRFCDTPWLLEDGDPLKHAVTSQWPSALTSLGRLYAMGADAYRLAPSLAQLSVLPGSQLDGLSGTLSLGPEQHVQRRLEWAEFRGGQVQRLPDERF